MKIGGHGCLAMADAMGAQAKSALERRRKWCAVLNTVLGVTCERPPEMHNDKNT